MQHMTIRVWERGDTVFGTLTLPIRGGGNISLTMSVTSMQVVQALRRAGVRFNAQAAAQIGSVFGSIGKFVKKVAKSSVVKGLIKAGTSIAKTAAPFVKMIVPGAAQALEAANGAIKLINAARAGNPKAKLAVKAAAAQADLENKQGQQLPLPSGVRAKGPMASAAFRYMVTVKRAEAA
jgi:hypothetical protein